MWVRLELVPTPISEQEVDMNAMVMQASDISRRNLLARSFYLTNRAPKVKFEKLQNVLKINEDSFIHVTRGTFSAPISVRTADDSRFISNLQISASAPGFVFSPERMNIYLGDYGTEFRVGADKNLMEKSYGFSVQMEEKSSNPVYSVASSMILFVESKPLEILLPSDIRVPRGGCALFRRVVLKNAPTQAVDLVLQYDYSQYPEELFRVDLELSSYVLSYNMDTTYRFLAFCVSHNFPAS